MMDFDYRNTRQPQPWGFRNHFNNSPSDRMHNMFQVSNSNGREARNRAEKNRRDKLNGSIQELSSMVPHVAESQRRVDKTAILRFSAHRLRLDYVFGNAKPNTTQVNSTATESFLKLMDSFLITVTIRGQILLVSPSIEHHLGHCQSDLFGQNIYNFIHPDDHALFKKQIVPTKLDTLFEEDSDESQPRTPEEEENIDKILKGDKRNFTMRFARAGPRSEPTTYETIRINGNFRRADLAPRGVRSTNLPTGFQLVRARRTRDDLVPLHSISSNDIVLIGIASVIRLPTICDRLIEACKFEYKTRHLTDGRIVQCDQRISMVAGFMTDEVCGLSPFTFMHRDDVRWVIVALRQMYDYSKPYGESCYRLMTRTGAFIYLRTRGYLEIDSETNKVHSFCCINTLVPEEEGRKLVREMKKKFSVIINSNDMLMESNVPSVENAQQIEKAVFKLIKNLYHSPNTNSNESVDDLQKDDKEKTMIEENNDKNVIDKNLEIKSDIEIHQSELQRKSPSLAIIAPKPCAVKSAISKSRPVIVAATKGGGNLNVKATSPTKEVIVYNSNNKHKPQKRTSVLQKTSTYTSNYKMEENQISNVIIDRQIPNENSTINCGYNFCEIQSPPIQQPTNILLPHQIKQEYCDYSSPTKYEPNYNSSYCESVIYSPPPKTQQQTNLYSQSPQAQYCTSTLAMLDTVKNPMSYSRRQSCITNSNLKRGNFLDDFDSKETITKRRMINQEDSILTASEEELRTFNKELTRVLPTSFESIDRSLEHISDATAELCNQYNTYSVFPNSQQHKQIYDIIEETQEQREMLQSIQSDYNTNIQRKQQSNNLLLHENITPSTLRLSYDDLVGNTLTESDITTNSTLATAAATSPR